MEDVRLRAKVLTIDLDASQAMVRFAVVLKREEGELTIALNEGPISFATEGRLREMCLALGKELEKHMERAVGIQGEDGELDLGEDGVDDLDEEEEDL